MAKPRDSTSPNFKAFESMKTSTSVSENKFLNTHSFKKSKNYGVKHDSEIFSPILQSDKYLPQLEKANYFTLRNKIKNPVEKPNYTDRLNNFIQRFSQQLSIDSEQKQVFDGYRKRFSVEDQDTCCKKCEGKYPSILNNK